MEKVLYILINSGIFIGNPLILLKEIE